MAELTDYLYDVFISYPHQDEHRFWVLDIFRPLLELHLPNELGRPVKIFSDREAIAPGNAWPETLKQALACSRSLVPVFSMQYFLSDWCMAECSVLLNRESKLDYRTVRNPRGLIFPVKLFDGKKYPAFADKIQPLDCTDFNVINPDYKKTTQYNELQKLLKNWTPRLADSIDNAPGWDTDWLTEAWLDEPIEQWIHNPSFQFPKHPFRPPSIAPPAIA